MLILVPPPYQADQLADARELLRLAESSYSALGVLCELFLLPLLGLALLLSGVHWGGLLVGAAVALALSRYGPHWWPGRR